MSLKKKFLSQVEVGLETVLADNVEDSSGNILYRSARHLCLSKNSKRARPQLALLFGKAVGTPLKQLEKISIAAELVHAASLLHDDVIDKSSIRRGKPSVNALHGNTIAVLTGDLLLTQALELLYDLEREITFDALNVVKNMTLAISLEVQSRGQVEISDETWHTIAAGKTGILFGWCGQAAALCMNDKASALAFNEAGLHLGVAFQIADDIKDFYAAEQGKTKYADIYNKNPNFVSMLACERSASIKNQITELWQYDDLNDVQIKELGKAIVKTGATDEAFNRIDIEVQKSLDILESVASEEAKNDLKDWISQLGSGLAKRHAVKWRSNLIAG